MTISWRPLVVSSFLIFLAGAAWASPNFGSNCTSCHTRADGAFSFLPSNLLQILPGQTREITINVTDAAPGVTSALSLTGPNASGLAATAGAPWTNQGGWWTLGPFSGTGQKSLNLTLGAGAVTGTMSLSQAAPAQLAGAGAEPGASLCRWLLREFLAITTAAARLCAVAQRRTTAKRGRHRRRRKRGRLHGMAGAIRQHRRQRRGSQCE
jgi:hypothetical protein